MCREEAERLLGLFSLSRESYGMVLSVVSGEHGMSELKFLVSTSYFLNNYIGGSIGGEHRSGLKLSLETARSERLLNLYLSPFKSAKQERDLEFKYFRFWSLIETVARSHDFISRPKRKWDSNVALNKRGIPIYIQDHAADIVFELLRVHFSGGKELSLKLTGILQRNEVSDMVSIWYRHRNCVAHSGGCFPGDPHISKRNKPDYVKCKAAHQEIVETSGFRNYHNDIHLKNFEEICKEVIYAEITDIAKKKRLI